MTPEQLQTLFGSMALINLGIFFLAVALLYLMRGVMEKYHTKIYRITAEDIGRSYYSAMTRYKNGIIFFNVVPWIALQLL